MIVALKAKAETPSAIIGTLPKLNHRSLPQQIVSIINKFTSLSAGSAVSILHYVKVAGKLTAQSEISRQTTQHLGGEMDKNRLSNLLILIGIIGGAGSFIFIIAASRVGPNSASNFSLSIAVAANSFLILVVAIVNSLLFSRFRKFESMIREVLELLDSGKKDG